MADLRAVVQHIGRRVLGEDFDIDEWQAPAGLVEQISKPSAEIAAVRDDFARALEAIAHRTEAIEQRLDQPTADQSLVIMHAVKDTVDARLASLPQPTSELRQVDHAALADVTDRLEIMERAIAGLRAPAGDGSLTTAIERLEVCETNSAAAMELSQEVINTVIPQLANLLREVTAQMREAREQSTHLAATVGELRSTTMRQNRHIAAAIAIMQETGAA